MFSPPAPVVRSKTTEGWWITPGCQIVQNRVNPECMNFRLHRFMLIGSFLLLFTPSFEATAGSVATSQQQRLLTEVLDECSETYRVFFNYREQQVAHLKVDFDLVAGEEFNTALQRLMKVVGLDYEIASNRFVIVSQKGKNDVGMARKLRGSQNYVERLEDDLAIKSGVNYSLQRVVEYSRQVAVAVQTITGTVSDEDGVPLIGVTIQVEGSTSGTVTDIDGNYSLAVEDGQAVLLFSYVGYRRTSVAVGNQSTIDVVLTADAAQLDEVVVIGYGTQQRSDVTGAVATANLEAFRESPNVSIVQSLQGSVPGLSVGQVDQAGQSPSISVRGRTSINGNQNPFIVLDGIPYSGSLADLNPNDIQSINVLKDPSSKAIYGAQSANGVILIESKKGLRGESKPIVNYSASYTTQNPTNALTLLDRDAFIEKSFLYDYELAYQGPGFTELKPGISYLDAYIHPQCERARSQRPNFLPVIGRIHRAAGLHRQRQVQPEDRANQYRG